MTERRQSSIGITPSDKAKLEGVKKAYERETGCSTDWGTFLLGVAALGLVGLGIHQLAKANRDRPTTQCPYCGRTFPIAHAGDLPAIANVVCPYPDCGQEMVVNFRE